MLIDAHTHYWVRKEGYSSKWYKYINPDFADMLMRHRIKSGEEKSELMPIPWETWIEQIKETGFDKVVVIPEDRTRVWNMKVRNEAVAELVNDYPDLFIGFASTDPINQWGQFKRECLEEIDKAVNELGLKGVKLYPSYCCYYPHDKKVYPLYEKIVELDVPIIFHQGASGGHQSRTPEKYTPVLFLDEVLEDFPELRISVAHLAYPRCEELYCIMNGRQSPTEVYSDISALCYRPFWLTWQLVIAKEYGVLDRIMFGTDGPGMCRPTKKYLEFIKTEMNSIAEKAGWPTFTKEEIDGILGGNAAKFLRL